MKMLCLTSTSCFYVVYEPRYEEVSILRAAILKFKMAASYHGDSDGYLGLYESTHVKLLSCMPVIMLLSNFARFL